MENYIFRRRGIFGSYYSEGNYYTKYAGPKTKDSSAIPGQHNRKSEWPIPYIEEYEKLHRNNNAITEEQYDAAISKIKMVNDSFRQIALGQFKGNLLDIIKNLEEYFDFMKEAKSYQVKYFIEYSFFIDLLKNSAGDEKEEKKEIEFVRIVGLQKKILETFQGRDVQQLLRRMISKYEEESEFAPRNNQPNKDNLVFHKRVIDFFEIGSQYALTGNKELLWPFYNLIREMKKYIKGLPNYRPSRNGMKKTLEDFQGQTESIQIEDSRRAYGRQQFPDQLFHAYTMLEVFENLVTPAVQNHLQQEQRNEQESLAKPLVIFLSTQAKELTQKIILDERNNQEDDYEANVRLGKQLLAESKNEPLSQQMASLELACAHFKVAFELNDESETHTQAKTAHALSLLDETLKKLIPLYKSADRLEDIIFVLEKRKEFLKIYEDRLFPEMNADLIKEIENIDADLKGLFNLRKEHEKKQSSQPTNKDLSVPAKKSNMKFFTSAMSDVDDDKNASLDLSEEDEHNKDEVRPTKRRRVERDYKKKGK